jgi:hypothetical protein
MLGGAAIRSDKAYFMAIFFERIDKGVYRRMLPRGSWHNCVQLIHASSPRFKYFLSCRQRIPTTAMNIAPDAPPGTLTSRDTVPALWQLAAEEVPRSRKSRANQVMCRGTDTGLTITLRLHVPRDSMRIIRQKASML